MTGCLSKQHNQWVKLGKAKDIMEELVTSISATPKDSPDGNDGNHVSPQEGTSVLRTSTKPTSTSPGHSTPIRIDCDCHTCKIIGPAPPPISGKVRVPVWSLQENPAMPTTDQHNKSFEELVVDDTKGPTGKPAAKRQQVGINTKIMTDATYLEELQCLEKEPRMDKKDYKKKVIKS